MTDKKIAAKPAASSPVDGRTIVGRRNREALIRAAQELFREGDYNAVAIRDIIGRAGVGLGTFYNHFSDKEELLRLILEESRTKSLDRQHELRAEAKSFSEFMHNHFTFFFNMLATEPAYLALLGTGGGGLVSQIVDAPAHLKGMAVLQEDLEEAVRRGLLAPMDTEYLAVAIRGIALEVGQIMVRRVPRDPEAASRFAAQLVLTGLASAPEA